MGRLFNNGSCPLIQEDRGIETSDLGQTPAGDRFDFVEVEKRSHLSPEEKAIRAGKRKLWRVFRAAVIQKTGSRDLLILSRCRTQFEKAWKRGGEEGLADRDGYYILHIKNYAFRVALTEAAKVRWARETEEEREQDRRHQKERRRIKKEVERERVERANRLLSALGSGEARLSDLDIGARLDLMYAIKRAPLKRKKGPEQGASESAISATSGR